VSSTRADRGTDDKSRLTNANKKAILTPALPRQLQSARWKRISKHEERIWSAISVAVIVFALIGAAVLTVLS
jgi:uncharacterized membrane protein YdfJ with MMPL/SSD domain